MILNYYEKRLLKVLMANPNINTRKFIELSGIGRNSFYKYVERLEASGYVSNRQVKNQLVWFAPKRDKRHDLGMSIVTEPDIIEKRYQKIESLVLNSLKELKKGNISEKIDIYGNAAVLILGTLASMKLISLYRKKRIPDHYVQYTKKLERLLTKISNSKFFSDYGFGKVAVDSLTHDAESKLEEFLGIKPETKVSIF
ncbi:MAG: winged helix-turn-helix domain-containing protein [Candidatus Nitrosotenuis sp.]